MQQALDKIEQDFFAPAELVRVMRACYRELGYGPNSAQLLRRMLALGGEVVGLSYNDNEVDLAVQIADPVVAACGLVKKEFEMAEIGEADLDCLLRIVRGPE